MAKKIVKMSKKDIKAYLFDLETVKAKMDAKINNLTVQAKSLMEDAKWLDAQYAQYKKAISVDVNPGEDGIEVEVETEGAEKVTVDDKVIKGDGGENGEGGSPIPEPEGIPEEDEVNKLNEEMVKIEARYNALKRRKANLVNKK